MADPRAKDIMRRHDALKSARSNHEVRWQELVELVRPMSKDFNIKSLPGEQRGLNRFDGTPSVAADNLASGLWGMLTNSANNWFSLGHENDQISQDGEFQQWRGVVERVMRGGFAAGGQRFYTAALSVYQDVATFGTAVLYVDEVKGQGRIRFQAMPLADCLIAQDDEDRVDTVLYSFEWTASQAVARWGRKAPEKARMAMDANRPDEKVRFVYAVEPNRDYSPNYADARGMRWRACHVCRDSMEIVQEGGFKEFPYMVPRWSTGSGEVYGDSPALLAMTDIKLLNSMTKTFLVASQKAADPPLLAADENTMSRVRVRPGGITYGAVDANGRALLQTLDTKAAFQLTDAMLEQKRQAVRDAFYASLLMMTNQPGRTATEVLALQEEKLRLMGPQLGRMQSEFLDPLIQRVFAIMDRGGAFPPAPQILATAPSVQVTYVSPLARAQKSTEGAAIMRVMEAAMPLIQMQPDVADNIDFDAVLRGLADAFDMPASMRRDPKKVLALRQAKQAAAEQAQQQQQMAGMAEMAPGLAGAMKDLAGAGMMPGGGQRVPA